MATADIWPALRRITPTRRGPFGLFVIGRLRPLIRLDDAQRDLAGVSRRIFPDWRTSFQDSVARLTPYSLRETIVGRAERPLALFSAAVAMLLLIAVANVASLSIVRGMRRWREISMRSVLGASRGRLLRLVVTESIVLAFVGGVLGLVLAWFGLVGLQHLANDMPRLSDARIDARALAMALATSITAGLAIGIFPATRLVMADADHHSRGGMRSIGDTRRSESIRALFVGAEFALALPMLAAGALLVTSFLRLSDVDLGFDPRAMVVTRVSVPSSAYQNDTSRARFWASVGENLRESAGVASVALSTALPPNDDGNNNENFELVDSPVPPGGAQPTVTWPAVSRDFFTALSIPLLEGRLFVPNDTGVVPVAVVTRAWAKHYFPGRSALGREMIVGGCQSCPHTVVVGIVGDATFDGLGAPREVAFRPLTEGWPSQLYLFVRGSAQSGVLERTIRDAVHAADPSAAIGAPTRLQDNVHESIAQPRHWAIILIAFSAAALLLAVVGIFGLVSYTVALRRREIGVRMALGASSGEVVGWLVASGLRFALAGSAAGLGLTILTARWLRSSLYDVSAVDPAILLGVTLGLVAVGTLASWLPARQAATIDPVEAMRPD
jgi:predicted permease